VVAGGGIEDTIEVEVYLYKAVNDETNYFCYICKSTEKAK
jgi:hypothetical protein